MKKKTKYQDINNLARLRREKKILSKKIRIREKLLKRRVKKIQKIITPDYVYTEILKTVKMEDSLLVHAPKVLKLKVPIQNVLSNQDGKKMIVPLLSGLGAAITSFFAMRKKKKIITENNNSEEQMFI